ncbi:hypothetical protein EVAR_53521_1 [Eumeta japonica]|uniref:Uncharacterized protein n=1 Tax=Eumeta variegata TaxID=151549 RepID=A0A4C1Y8I9_EUMVA|nr:hypothetical protein EVAR_53521_1 [Eumeta japonica]
MCARPRPPQALLPSAGQPLPGEDSCCRVSLTNSHCVQSLLLSRNFRDDSQQAASPQVILRGMYRLHDNLPRLFRGEWKTWKIKTNVVIPSATFASLTISNATNK